MNPDALSNADDAKIEYELHYFLAHHTELLEQYRGLCIAIHQHTVIDTDKDEMTLYLRVGEVWGNETPILITQVTEKPMPEFIVRSPRLERHT